MASAKAGVVRTIDRRAERCTALHGRVRSETRFHPVALAPPSIERNLPRVEIFVLKGSAVEYNVRRWRSAVKLILWHSDGHLIECRGSVVLYRANVSIQTKCLQFDGYHGRSNGEASNSRHRSRSGRRDGRASVVAYVSTDGGDRPVVQTDALHEDLAKVRA